MNKPAAKFFDLSISAKLTLVIVLAALVTALATGCIAYIKFAAEIETEAKNKLSALYHLPLIRTHVPNPGFRWTLWSTVPG